MQPLLAVLAVASIFLLYNKPRSTSLADAWVGLAIVWLGVGPSCAYLLNRRRPPMPLMALTGLYYVSAFGLPVFQEHVGPYVRYTEISTHAALLVAAGLSFLYCGHYMAQRFLVRGIRHFSLPPQDPGKLRTALWLLMALHLASVYIAPLRAISSISQFAWPAGFVASGMLLWQYLRGELSKPERFLLLLAIFLQFLARLASGSLAQLPELGIFLIIVYWAQRRHIPWKSTALLAILFVLFHGVKNEFRRAAWYGEYREANTLQKDALFVELSGSKLVSEREYGGLAYDSVVNRNSQIGFLTYVIQQTPDNVPYWNGSTYSTLLYMMIPRILWRDKPTEKLGYEFSRRYGMRSERDLTTSYNLPWVVELYANFGDAGVLLGMAFIGILFSSLEAKFNTYSMSPLELIVGMTVLHNLSNHESNFSVTCGNIAVVALTFWIYFSVFAARPFARRVRRAAVPAVRNDAVAAVNPYQPA